MKVMFQNFAAFELGFSFLNFHKDALQVRPVLWNPKAYHR